MLCPDPFQPHPDGDWEKRWRPIALDRIIDALRRYPKELTLEEFKADKNPRGAKRWLWYMHHPDDERWKNIGRPYWSLDAYMTWRCYYFWVPERQRLHRDGRPDIVTLPKKSWAFGDVLHHEHVVPQRDSLRQLLNGVDPVAVVARNLGAVITERESKILRPDHPDPSDPWLRYKGSGIAFIPNPTWTEEEQAALKRYDLLFEGEIERYMAGP